MDGVIVKPEDLKAMADKVRAVLRAASVGIINPESASLAESYFDVLMTHFDQQREQLAVWTADEDETLCWLIDEGVTFAVIGKVLNRSVGSIENRYYRLYWSMSMAEAREMAS